MDADADNAPVSLHERCQYPNKQCPKRRTTKRNGQLHRFCEEHKAKANRNQRRWIENRMLDAKAKSPTSPPAPMPSPPPPSSPTNQSTEALPAAIDTGVVGLQALAGDDVAVDELTQILFDEDELNEFLDDLLLTPEELFALQEDVAKACRFLEA